MCLQDLSDGLIHGQSKSEPRIIQYDSSNSGIPRKEGSNYPVDVDLNVSVGNILNRRKPRLSWQSRVRVGQNVTHVCKVSYSFESLDLSFEGGYLHDLQVS